MAASEETSDVSGEDVSFSWILGLHANRPILSFGMFWNHSDPGVPGMANFNNG